MLPDRCFIAQIVADYDRPLPLAKEVENVLRKTYRFVRESAAAEITWDQWVFSHRVCSHCVDRDTCGNFKAQIMRAAREGLAQ